MEKEVSKETTSKLVVVEKEIQQDMWSTEEEKESKPQPSFTEDDSFPKQDSINGASVVRDIVATSNQIPGGAKSWPYAILTAYPNGSVPALLGCSVGGAFAAIRRAIAREAKALGLSEQASAARLYSKAQRMSEVWQGKDLTYCPSPLTWFNESRYNDPVSQWGPRERIEYTRNGKAPKRKASDYDYDGFANG